MNVLVTHLLLGPTLLVIGVLYKIFPPKKINHFYGYRTPRSMKNQETWNIANSYAAFAIIVASVLTSLFQVVMYTLIGGKNSIIYSAIFLTVMVIAVIPFTEHHLKGKGIKRKNCQ